MKKSLIFLALAAAVAAVVVSCSKEASNDNVVFEATAEQTSESGNVSHSESNGGSHTLPNQRNVMSEANKVVLQGSRLLWQAGDRISVYDASLTATVYGLASGAGTANAEYTRVSGSTPSATPYTAVYPAAIRTGASTVSLPEVQHTPDGSLTGMPMYAVSDDMELHFYNLCGVVRFRLSASSAVSVSRIAVGTDRNTNGAATISGSGSSVSLSTPGGNNVTTLACDVAQSVASARDFYMYLPAGTYSTFRILMTAADGSLCSKTANSNIVVERGKITTITLSGLTFTAHRFSTSSTESVVFAPGNLQYIGSAATPYWKFADRQYDYFGTTTSQNSTRSDVDRDLFGWGTSGWDNGNYWYMPYNIRHSTSEPYTGARGYGYGPTDGSLYTYNLTGTYANADWGVFNAIRNGGNAAGRWHTPSDADWTYIWRDRGAALRYAKAQIGGKRGLILFPDSYSHPAGLASLASTNTVDAAFTTNQYSYAEWLQMEAAGAVFLPAAGYRIGSSVGDVGTNGGYWSSSFDSGSYAYYVSFTSGDLSRGSIGRSFGSSVRLVRG